MFVGEPCDVELGGKADVLAGALWIRRMPLILLVGGLIVAACYYVVAVQCGANGHPAPPQSDTLIYLQYARAMAEGHPYVFNPGDAPSTGSTSHLYPAVLALAYRLGAHGDALLSAGFLINVCCYLVWLQLFWCVARRWVPDQAVLASGLILLNGHLALVAMGQSDVGLFLVLSWGLLAALLVGRFRWATVLAVLCALARPEGMVLATGFVVLTTVLAGRRNPLTRSLLWVAGGGMLAVAAVLSLNRALTGMWQFQSVAGKGYLNNYPLLGALGCMANDFLVLLREVFFNLGTAPRQNYFLPMLGGCLAIVGLDGLFRVSRARPGTRTETCNLRGVVLVWWLDCCLASLALVAMSEFMGMGNDRYLAWILPVWYLLAAAGVGQVARFFAARRCVMVLGVVLLGFEVGSWPYFLSRYATQDAQMQSWVSFAKDVHTTLPSGVPVGMLAGTGLRYYFDDRPMRHLNGVTSSAFRGQRDLVCSIETLRHEPDLRFGYWLVPPSIQGWCDATGLLGPCVLSDTDGPPGEYAFGLFQARWDSMPPASLRPLDAAVTNAIASMKMVDHLDVGYMPDERRCHYRTGSRLPDAFFLPFAANRRLGKGQITEVGQPVIGWDEFRIAAPQRLRPLRVVLRTALDATCTGVRLNTRHDGEVLHLRSPLRLRLLVNNVALPETELAVTCADDAFAECVLEIPAELITTDPLEVVIAGDHIALAYWFYQ